MTILRHQFGDTWWEYLPAATFSYNICVNESTGYSPFELVYQRVPALPADLAVELQVEVPINHRDYSVNAAVRMRAAFLHVREVQQRAAEKNRERRLRSAKAIEFQANDMVLKWEPSLQTDKVDDKTKGRIPIPGKWKDTWSGPHLVRGVLPSIGSHPDGNKYSIQLAGSGKTEAVHVNMLHLFTPWSDTVLSSSYDPSGSDPRGWSDRGKVPVGELFAVKLKGGYGFGIGVVRGFIAARDGKGDYLQYQWLGNSTNALRSKPILPGWVAASTTDTGAIGQEYYSSTAIGADVPYTGAISRTPVRDTDVLLHSFKLTGTQRLPVAIHRSIMAATQDSKE
jgi:hypothetical protein